MVYTVHTGDSTTSFRLCTYPTYWWWNQLPNKWYDLFDQGFESCPLERDLEDFHLNIQNLIFL